MNTSSKDTEHIKNELLEIKMAIKDLKKNLKGLIEVQQRLIHERLGAPVPPSPKEYGEDTKSKVKLVIEKIDEDNIKVSGNTFDFKNLIKESGISKWDQSTKSWSGSVNNLPGLISKLNSSGLVKNIDYAINIEEEENTEETNEETNNEETNNEETNEETDEGFGSGYTS